MTTFILAFLAGLVVGAFLGSAATCLVWVSQRDRRRNPPRNNREATGRLDINGVDYVFRDNPPRMERRRPS